MHDHNGDYCIIQYCPDLDRAEAVNIGVAVFWPAQGQVAVQMTETNVTVRKRFGRDSFDSKRLTSEKRAFETRLKGLRGKPRQDILHFIACEAGRLVMTQPRPLRVDDAERDARALFDEVVTSAPLRRDRVRAPDLHPIFDPLVAELGPKIRVLQEKIVVPRLGKRLVASYAYQNGRINYIKPQGFGAHEESALNTATILGVQGHLLARHATDEGVPQRLVVVTAYEDPGLGNRIELVLQDCSVKCVRIEAVGEFTDEIRREVH